jgi:hypothetical protein
MLLICCRISAKKRRKAYRRDILLDGKGAIARHLTTPKNRTLKILKKNKVLSVAGIYDMRSV